MKIDKALFEKIQSKLVAFATAYAVFIFIVGSLLVLSFFVYRINSLANQEPSESAIAEKAGESRPATIDKKAVEKIQELQSTNVEVKALFDQNRDNPFRE